MAANAIAHYTASGDIPAISSIEGVVLTAAAATATATIKAGGSSGTTLLELSAAANSSVVCPFAFVCGTSAYITLSGTGAKASVVYR